jgi:hypothetical protein
VYYRAFRAERRRLDAFVTALNVPAATVASWPRDRQVAFWLNAYNALVLRTVIDHYPIQARTKTYPASSLRQVPGAFDRRSWRVAGAAVSLDDIEKTHLASFRDPRLFFAIGRGALGGGRLRSEAFDPERLESQLVDVVADCVRRLTCADVDEEGGHLGVSAIFSWREAEVVATAPRPPDARFAARSPLERAVLALIEPHLFPSERAWLGRNTFAMRFTPFDWRLNDLTGGPPR